MAKRGLTGPNEFQIVFLFKTLLVAGALSCYLGKFLAFYIEQVYAE